MKNLRKFAMAALALAVVVGFASCEDPEEDPNTDPTPDTESVFAVEYDGEELEDGDVITVTEIDAFNTMHFGGTMYNDDKSERDLTITETRQFDLDTYTMEGCIGISCVPSNGETTEVWSATTGATSPGGSENFEFKLSIPDDYLSVEAIATSVFVFSNGDEEVSVTVNFVIAGE
ncbi:MAG: hypothetical protein R3Y59_05690 [bacterium]